MTELKRIAISAGWMQTGKNSIPKFENMSKVLRDHRRLSHENFSFERESLLIERVQQTLSCSRRSIKPPHFNFPSLHFCESAADKLEPILPLLGSYDIINSKRIGVRSAVFTSALLSVRFIFLKYLPKGYHPGGWDLIFPVRKYFTFHWAADRIESNRCTFPCEIRVIDLPMQPNGRGESIRPEITSSSVRWGREGRVQIANFDSRLSRRGDRKRANRMTKTKCINGTATRSSTS